MPDLRAPFVYFGGKRTIAPLIWARIGDVPNWVCPFFGSGAVELARPHLPKTETLGDASAMVSNFFRAVVADPEAVAHHADWPAHEADLIARFNWLMARQDGLRERLMGDPTAYDAMAAGWWVLGASATVGKTWHLGRPVEGACLMPSVKHSAGINRLIFSGRSDPEAAMDRIGYTTIFDWFKAIADRLRGATFICGSWERLMGPTTCGYTDSDRGVTGLLLDPPYPSGGDAGTTDTGMYGANVNHNVWYDVAKWCEEHGHDKRLRICLCGYDGTWKAPDGWDCVPWKSQGGYSSQSDDGSESRANTYRERLWFSPGCLPAEGPKQRSLF